MSAFGKSFSFTGSPRPAATTSPLNITPRVRVGQGTTSKPPQKAQTGSALRLTGKCVNCR